MQPSPMAETSRLLFPSLRVCIAIILRTLLCCSKDTECRLGRAFPILPILCLILPNVLFLCTVKPGE
jgi:hypothetical protein